ncbi:MAG: CPBP family intramembrane glutamic endopeptidase [Thermoanaerobaculia bacterium]|nr:CPBP family intramembrane glutamic endopeptidase [Thermoanaerobaculia bacterium]
MNGSSRESPAVPPGKLFRFGAGFYLVVAVIGVVAVGLRQGRVPVALFLDPERWSRDLLLGLGAGGAVLAVWAVLVWTLPVARRLEEALASLVRSLSPGEALALACLSGFSEELLFRGAIQSAWGFWPATILFALLHTGRQRFFWLWTVSAFGAGALFGVLFAWRGNLLAPMVAHGLINGVQLLRLRMRPPGPE